MRERNQFGSWENRLITMLCSRPPRLLWSRDFPLIDEGIPLLQSLLDETDTQLSQHLFHTLGPICLGQASKVEQILLDKSSHTWAARKLGQGGIVQDSIWRQSFQQRGCPCLGSGFPMSSSLKLCFACTERAPHDIRTCVLPCSSSSGAIPSVYWPAWLFGGDDCYAHFESWRER